MAMIDRIRQAAHAQPFRPFALRMVDGREYLVEHPDFLTIPPMKRPREVYFYTFDQHEPDDYTTHWINIGLVKAVAFPGGREAVQTEANGDDGGSA
ncbi:MAG: hypothetical protein ACHRXM_18495 [Isosphaerales bacterium]